MRYCLLTVLLCAVAASGSGLRESCAQEDEKPSLSYAIPDTGQDRCYGSGKEIAYPKPGEDYYGQDAQYEVNKPDCKDNGDGTVTDQITGLMWQKTPDFVKRTQDEAEEYAKKLKLAGHDDWRLPTIKVLFSIATPGHRS